jgi:predicted Rossmann fold flavoprotein
MIEKGYKESSLNFFNTLGLFTTIDNAGRIYPMSNQAITVVELLTRELFYKKVNVILNHEVKDLKVLADGRFMINDDIFDKVIISIGTNAGFSNEKIELVNKLPFIVKPYKPGLVGFKVKEDISLLFGVKASGSVRLADQKSTGEIMFKEDGVSGICVMDLSVFYDGQVRDIYFDFLDEYTFEQLKMIIDRKLKNDPYIHLHNLLFGSVNNKLLGFFNKGYPNIKVVSAPKEMLDSYLAQFKNFKLTIKDTYDLKTAHVGNGGILLSEVSNFESIKIKNLYLCGEVLDEVGICGGYNLWFAFTSGLMVADIICK